MSSDSWPCAINIFIIIAFVLLNAFVVASKRALDYIDRNFIKDELEDDPDNKRLGLITEFLSKPSKYHYADHVSCLFNLLICFYSFNYLIVYKYASAFNNSLWILVLVNIVFLMLYTALADILPKKLAAQTSEKTGVSLIYLQNVIYYITLPIVVICKGLSNIILLILGKETDVDDTYFTEDKVMSMLDQGQETGEIKEEGRKMIDSIFEFDDLLAYEIMTPRTDVFCIDLNDNREEYFDELMELTYSRIPVYEGDPDNIIGILHIKDYLYKAATEGIDSIVIKDLLRPAYFVPETKNIDSLFSELQKEKQHLAILIDEYGGFSGIVSVEDIIEQIVGDIDDEFDEEDRIINKVDENTYVVDGNVYLDDLDDETGIELNSENSETVGGFIIDLTGEIPKQKKNYRPIRYENYIITILQVKDRRIEKVKIEVLKEETSDK